MNRRRNLLLALSALLSARAIQAQSGTHARRVCVLGNDKTNTNELMPSFVASLRDLGWIESKTVTFDYRWAEQRYEQYPALIGELVALGCDLIMITAGVNAALAAKKSTATIPILLVGGADPVKFGLVDSFARPGGNVTGLTQPLADWGKFVELAREAVPRASRIAILANPANVSYDEYGAQIANAARQLGLALHMIPVTNKSGVGPAFDLAKQARADVLIVQPDGMLFNCFDEILQRARTNRLPVVAPFYEAAEQGALVSHSFDILALYRRAAFCADKLLRGTRPGDLPIEQPTRFKLTINLSTAKDLGLIVPQALRGRADKVIE